jgi:hypothetical protein
LIVLAEEVRHGKQPTFQRTVTKIIRNKETSGRAGDAEHLKELRKKTK